MFERPGSKAIVVERQDKDWRITEPMAWKADATAISQLLQVLGDLVADERIGDTNSPASYGLEPPSLVVRVRAAGSETSLEFGGATPIGNAQYMRLAGQPTVLGLSMEKFAIFDQSLSGLRDKRVLDVSPIGIRKLELRNASGTFIGLSWEKDAWQLMTPLRDRAETALVDNLVWAFSLMQAQEFIDNPPKLADYGLGRPALWVRLVAGSPPNEKSYTLEIGTAPADKDTRKPWEPAVVYVLAGGKSDTVFTVAQDLSELFSLKAEDLIEMLVFEPASVSRTQQVKLTMPKGTWTLRRMGEQWQLTPASGEPIAVSAERANAILAAVREVAIEGIERKQTTQLPSGGERWTLQATTTDGKSMLLTAQGAAGKSPWLATVAGRPHRYRLDSSVLQRVQQTMAEAAK